MIPKQNKDAAIIAAALIYNRKVTSYLSAAQTPPIADLARDAASEAAVLVYAIEKHMAPRERR